METIQHQLPNRQAPQDCGDRHEWDHRGYCEDCGTPQPDYEPDDNTMPGLATNTDPWN